MTDSNSRFHLTPSELKMYSILSMEKNFQGIINTSYDTLKHVIRLGRNKKLTSNKLAIKKSMESLLKKGVINYREVNRNLLIVEIVELDEGYEKIGVDIANSLVCENIFTIYAAVKKWSNRRNGAIYSYNQWAEILGVSRVSAIRYIEEAVKLEIIYKLATAYSSENGANNYLVNKEINTEGFNCKIQ